jgi:hypothetical protein
MQSCASCSSHGVNDGSTTPTTWVEAFGTFDVVEEDLVVAPTNIGYFGLLPRDVFMYLLEFLLIPLRTLRRENDIDPETEKVIFFELLSARDMMRLEAIVRKVEYKRQPLYKIKVYPETIRSTWLMRFALTCRSMMASVSKFRNKLVKEKVFREEMFVAEVNYNQSFHVKYREAERRRNIVSVGRLLCPSMETFIPLAVGNTKGVKVQWTVALTFPIAGTVTILDVWNSGPDHNTNFNKMLGHLKGQIDSRFNSIKPDLDGVKMLKLYTKFVQTECKHGPTCKRFACCACVFTVHYRAVQKI